MKIEQLNHELEKVRREKGGTKDELQLSVAVREQSEYFRTQISELRGEVAKQVLQ